jgi:Cellulase (glycosyl hydrolase family 5)
VPYLRATILGVAAVLTPAAAIAAVPAVQDDYLPVTTSSQLKSRLDLLASTGAKVTRFDIVWSDVSKTRPADPADPADPAYNFARVDKVIEGLLDRGIRPIVSVYSSPAWAARGKGAKKGDRVNPNAPDPKQFGAFMEAVATRYNGTFAAGSNGQGLLVRHWELWNEGNLARYLSPQFDRKKKPVSTITYAAMVREAYPRIKSANPDSIVLAGATGPKSKTDKTGLGTRDWMKALKTSKVKFDAYSQHIYPAAAPLTPNAPVPSWSSIPALLKEVDGFRKGMPMYITEAGYTTSKTPFRKNVKPLAESKQATYLKQIFGLKSVKSKRIPVVVWFNLQDNVNWPAGLMRASGAKKPSFAAFQSVAATARLPASLQP